MLPARRRGQPGQVADDANAAGGAACLAAAHARVRHVIAQTRLENAQAPRHAHGHAVRVGRRAPDHAAAALAQRARPARDQDQAQHTRVGEREPEDDRVENGPLRRRWQKLRRQIGRAPCRLLAERHDLPPALDQAEQRECRHQHRCCQRDRSCTDEKALETQPEIESDAAVRPRHQQQRELHPFHVRARVPIGVEGLGVIQVAPEQRCRRPHAGEVHDQQERNRQPQQKLDDFARLVLELPALVERPQAERPVDNARRIEHEHHRREAPERHVIPEPLLHRRIRNVAECVIREMREQVGKEDETAGDADLPDAEFR